MATNLKTLFQLIVVSPDRERAHVHFHSGPQGRPAACHDPRCASPQLTVQ